MARTKGALNKQKPTSQKKIKVLIFKSRHQQFAEKEKLRLAAEDRINTAVTAVSTKALSLREAASQYEISLGTLSRRMNGGLSRRDTHEREQCLSHAEEDELVKWVATMEKRFIPLSQRNLISCAESILLARTGKKKTLGKRWLLGFEERHPQLYTKYSQAVDSVRVFAKNPKTINDYFDLVREFPIGLPGLRVEGLNSCSCSWS